MAKRNLKFNLAKLAFFEGSFLLMSDVSGGVETTIPLKFISSTSAVESDLGSSTNPRGLLALGLRTVPCGNQLPSDWLCTLCPTPGPPPF